MPRKTIQEAVSNPQLLAELSALYTELERRIAAHEPVCRNRGVCCRFGAFGHRLYVTTLELVYFRAHHADRLTQGAAGFSPRDLSAPGGASKSQGAAGPDGIGIFDFSPREASAAVNAASPDERCPFQKSGRCTTREGRPVGCRVFFCESAREVWQCEITEWALVRLRELHDRFAVPYSYQEWLTALDEIRGFTLRASRRLKSKIPIPSGPAAP